MDVILKYKQQLLINERLTTMITLHTSLLNDNIGFNGEDIQVKTISGMEQNPGNSEKHHPHAP